MYASGLETQKWYQSNTGINPKLLEWLLMDDRDTKLSILIIEDWTKFLPAFMAFRALGRSNVMTARPFGSTAPFTQSTTEPAILQAFTAFSPSLMSPYTLYKRMPNASEIVHHLSENLQTQISSYIVRILLMLW